MNDSLILTLCLQENTLLMNNSIPYSFKLPTIETRDTMTEEQFHAVMAKGLEEAKAEKGKGIDDAFAEINTGI